MGIEKDVRLVDVMSGQDRRIVGRPEKLQKKKKRKRQGTSRPERVLITGKDAIGRTIISQNKSECEWKRDSNSNSWL